MEPRHIALLGFLGGTAYLYWRHQQQVNTTLGLVADKTKEVAGTVRVPMPFFVATIPRTKDELDTVDKFLCMCVRQADLNSAPEQMVADLQFCLAGKLYPEFPWPPAPGDHESVGQLWLLLEYRIRSLANTGDLVRLCLPKPPVPDIPVPTPDPETGPGLHIPAQTTGP